MKRIYILLVIMLAEGYIPMLAEEYVSVKASSVALTGNGRLWTTVVGESENQGRSVILSWTDDLEIWERDTLASEDFIEAVLWTDPSDCLWMFCSTSDGNIKTRRCADPGASDPMWENGADVGRGPWKCTSAPVVTDGAWVLPVAFQKGVCTVSSMDGGASWTVGKSFIRVPDKVSGDNNPVISADDRKMSIFMRSTGSTHCYRADSYDQGQTWNAPVEFIPNPDRDICFNRLPDGRLLIVKCSRLDHNVHRASLDIIAYISDDDGQTWYGGFAASSGRKAVDPRTAVGKDGSVYIFYTYDAEGIPQARICRTTMDRIAEGTVWREVRSDGFTIVCTAGKAEENSIRMTAPRTQWASETLRLATWNIQYRAKKPSWTDDRLPSVISLLEEYDFDVFGSQEPYITQIEDMMEEISDRYAWLGECTGDPSSRKTHYNPIFYKKDRLEVLEHGTVPFSEVAGTIGYGAMYARSCTWAKFKDRRTGNIFFLFNSHFDHQGVEAREVSAEILVSAVRRIAAGYPAFLTGDFNSDEDTVPYKIILDSGFINDSMTAVDDPENAEYFSMSRYKPMETVKKTGKHIDHIFYTPNSVRIESWKLITDSYNGRFGSDHLPIMVEMLTAN